MGQKGMGGGEGVRHDAHHTLGLCRQGRHAQQSAPTPHPSAPTHPPAAGSLAKTAPAWDAMRATYSANRCSCAQPWQYAGAACRRGLGWVSGWVDGGTSAVMHAGAWKERLKGRPWQLAPPTHSACRGRVGGWVPARSRRHSARLASRRQRGLRSDHATSWCRTCHRKRCAKTMALCCCCCSVAPHA